MRNRNKQEEPQFDLDEELLEDNNWSSKNLPKSKMAAPKLDFEEIEEDDLLGKPSKLPIINPRFSGRAVSENKPSAVIQKSIEVTKLSSIKKKQPTYDFLDEDILDDQPPVNNKRKQPTPPIKKEPEPQEENYEQDFEAEDYGQDFEQFKEEDDQKMEQPSLKASPTVKKYSSGEHRINDTVKTIPKKNFVKDSSRKSVSGHSQRRSSTVYDTKRKQQQGRYVNEGDKQLPDVENLKLLSIDKINKENEKIRMRILHLNNQLNNIINKNVTAIKKKEQSKQIPKNTEGRLKVLEEERKNNIKMLERMQFEIEKMRFREGELKQVDYQWELHQRRPVLEKEKKQLEAIIVRLKLEVENEGKRLYSVENSKGKQANQPNNEQLLHLRSEEIAMLNNISQLDAKIAQLQNKIPEMDDRITELIRQAKSKNAILSPKKGLTAKYEQLIKRRDAQSKMLQAKKTNYASKVNFMMREIELDRRNIKNIESQIKRMYNDTDYQFEKSRVVILRNPKLPEETKAQLRKIQDMLVRPIITDYYEFKKSASRQSGGITKRGGSQTKPPKPKPFLDFLEADNLQPSQLQKVTVQKTPRKTVQLNKHEGKKPSVETKKVEPLEDQQQNNAYERIWQNDIEPSGKKKPAEQVVLPEKVASPVQEDDSKPKFMLRRRTNNPPEEPKKQNSIVAGKDNPIKKVQDEPTAEPEKRAEPQNPFSLGKFRSRDRSNRQIEKEQPIVVEQMAQKPVDKPFEIGKVSIAKKSYLDGEEDPKEPNTTYQTDLPEQRPIVAPKRIMIKRRGNPEGENSESAYNPNFTKPTQPIEQLPSNTSLPSKGIRSPINNPYAPSNPEEKPAIISNPPSVASPINNPYAPTNNPSPPSSNPYASNNPYAPKTDAPAYQPQREGRLKKPKVELPKEKYNIYEAAEEHNEVNQFMSAPKAVDIPRARQQKDDQPDLNKLLGLNQPKPADPQDQLLFGAPSQPKRRTLNRRPVGGDEFY